MRISSPRDDRPLAALRRDVEPGSAARDPLVLPVVLLLAVSVFLLARLQVGDWRLAAWFSLAIAIAIGILWLASWLLIRAVRREVTIPVIASGGAGRVEHFAPAVDAGADAVLAATVFHFGTLRIGEVKAALAGAGHPVR